MFGPIFSEVIDFFTTFNLSCNSCIACFEGIDFNTNVEVASVPGAE